MVIIVEEFKQFCQTTTIRGVPKVVKSQEIFLKIVWTIFVFVCLATFAYFFIGLFVKYYQWPVTTRFGENIKGHIVFPDITICSLNRFANNYGKDKIRDYFQILRQLKGQDSDEEEQMSFDYINSMFGLISLLSKNELEDDDCPNLITHCELYSQNWQFQRNCTNNFEYSWNAQYHDCYTMRTSVLNESTETRGMTLLLNNGPPFTEHIPYGMSLTSSQSNGVRMVIHSPGTLPDFKRGFSIGTGTENVIKIVQTKVERLHTPHNPYDCTSQTYMENSTKAKYSRDICIEQCSQINIFESCGCTVNWYDIPDSLRDVELCGNWTNANWTMFNEEIEKLKCGSSIEPMSEQCENGCLLSCSETTYNYFVASTPWPPKFIELGLFENYIEGCLDDHPQVKERFRAYECLNAEVTNSTTANTTCGNYQVTDLNEIEKSFMLVKIVIEEDFPYSLVDKPSYAWEDMLGLIGGMLSLWLGISVMTVVEILELFYFILKRYFGKLQNYMFKVKPQVISWDILSNIFDFINFEDLKQLPRYIFVHFYFGL